MKQALPLYPTTSPPKPDKAQGEVLPFAMLSLHSHQDRSFLDDVALYHLTGSLRWAGFAGDLVVGYLPAQQNEEHETQWALLLDTLRQYPTILYERVWSPAIIQRLRNDLPNARLIQLRGEHELLNAPADHICRPAPASAIELISALCGVDVDLNEMPKYIPHLHPKYSSNEAIPKSPSFPIMGNVGCPHQEDARKNPIFDGVTIPAGVGLGCSFCTTGNHFEYKPKTQALEWALEQLRYIRKEAPSITTLVLRDQNPFYYLTELIEVAEQEKLGPFTLLLESRADWFMQNTGRFERALQSATRSSIKIAPFLIGIENFSQPELDRFNKSMKAEQNIRFLETLWSWKSKFTQALDLTHAAFGFILFTPWTTMDDLRTNLEAVKKTRFFEFRGHILLSRARLYPDTALYYLAEKDNLLADHYEHPDHDASARYGYLPARPWRFADKRVSKLADLATALLQQRRKDELLLFEMLLTLIQKAEQPELLTAEDVERAIDTNKGRKNVAQSAGVTFRDPPNLEPQAKELKHKILQILVNAKELPVELPMFRLRLLDIKVDKKAIELLFGHDNPFASIRIEKDRSNNSVNITLTELVPDARRWSKSFDVLLPRLKIAITPEKFDNAMQYALELARLPVQIPLGFFRQIVAGVSPIQGQVRVGFLCNQDCGICWQDRDWGRFSAEQVVTWIHDLRNAGAQSLIITGGEPTLDPELLRYIRTARSIGFTDVTLETNAIQASKLGYAQQLAESGLTSAFVSLHSSDAETSDRITRAKGTHDRTVRGIKSLLANNIMVIINAVLTAEGLEHLAELPDFIHDNFGSHPKLQSLMISYPVEPYDKSLLPAILPSPEILREKLRQTIERACALGVNVQGLDGPCGPPLCAFAADRRVISGKPITGPVEFRRKLPACQQCSVQDECFGVRHADIEKYGERAISPIAHHE